MGLTSYKLAESCLTLLYHPYTGSSLHWLVDLRRCSLMGSSLDRCSYYKEHLTVVHREHGLTHGRNVRYP